MNIRKNIQNIFFSDFNEVERVGFPILLFLVLYGVFLTIVNYEYFDQVYVYRNGFTCYLQTLCIFLMGVLSFWRAFVIGPSKKNFLYSFVSFGFLLVFIFGVGEKQRWGQYIFNLELPEFFAKYNAQGQITIHNLAFGDYNINKIVFGSFLALLVVLYTLLLPYLYSKYEKVRSRVDSLGLPIAKRSHIAWYILGAIIALNVPAGKKGELLELVGCWSFLMIFAYPKNAHAFIKS